jgi:hypothetical protein
LKRVNREAQRPVKVSYITFCHINNQNNKNDINDRQLICYFLLDRLGSIMELTETERLLLVGKKEEIRKLTEELLDLTVSIERNRIEIKKKITGILSLLSTIASYSSPKNYDLNKITMMANMLNSYSFPFLYEVFCNSVNSIRFDFTRKDFKIIVPKIDLSIFRAK